MSPNVGNFVHDLVEMAKAMETLPQVQAELDRANTQIENYAKQVQDREIAIISYKQEIDDLHAKVRSLEVERDDASFRVLEAEDKAHLVLSLVRDTQTWLEKVVSELDPPKPEPVKESEAKGQSVENPTAPKTDATATVDQTGPNTTALSVPETIHSISEVSPGQSESSPTTAQSTEIGSTATTGSATEINDAVSAEPTHGPYFGKRYIDVDGYVSYRDWLDGGGTHNDYYGGRGI